MESDSVPLNFAKDIPDEIMFKITSSLTAEDIINVATTCKKLALTLNSDGAWEPKILDWIADQDVRSSIRGTPAAKMRDLLGLKTMRATYQALRLLKAWPQGLWYSADMHFQPDGHLVWVSHHSKDGEGAGASFEFTFVGPSCSYTGLEFPWPQERMTWGFYSREKKRPHGFLCALEIQPKKGVVCPELVSIFVESSDPKRPPYELHFNTYRKDSFQMMYHTDRNIALGNKEPDGCWNWHRTGVLDTKEYPPMPKPGLYCAIYGDHDMEIVELQRLFTYNFAAKIKGDENIPATQISFQFDSTVEEAWPGPWDSERYDPYPTTNGPRPVVMFVRDFEEEERVPVVVNMEDRPVSMVIQNERTRGQINRDPNEWDPEWVPATVVLYDYSKLPGAKESEVVLGLNRRLNESERVAFSVIFEDPCEATRHILDFYRVQLPRGFYCQCGITCRGGDECRFQSRKEKRS